MPKDTRSDERGKPIAKAETKEAGDKERQTFLAAIVESSEDAIVAFDPDGTVTYWNQGAGRVFGYTPEEMLGRSILILAPRHEAENERKLIEKVGRGQSVGHHEADMLRKGGEKINVRVTFSPVKDADGYVISISAFARDISDEISRRKLTEQRLAAASAYARSLIESSLDPLVTISAEGKITDVNEATIAVTGVARDKLIGTDFSNYFTEPDLARKGYQQVFAQGYVKDYPLTIRHTNGRLTDVIYNA
ncbi:MAG TPA: PAS domain S-box protein, partial [Methanomassiliicoccales archaeon]|nr:PAS domain S-box protein [Methanomassiliicoccales archaeon]